MSALALTVEKRASSAQPAPRITNVVSFSGARQPTRRHGFLIAANNKPTAEVVRIPLLRSRTGPTPAPAATGGAFAGKKLGATAAPTRDAAATADQEHLTLTEFIMTAFLFLSAASPPALMWLALQTAQ